MAEPHAVALTGDPMDAERALQLGLVAELAEPADVMAAVGR